MVLAIDQALAASKVPHAIGGAVAYAYYGEPRATIDVDVNVFVPTERWPQVAKALAALGIDVEVDEAAIVRDGQVRLWWGRIAVDLFFSYDPFHDEMEGAVRRVPFGDVRTPILGPEHLLICKAVFDRPKDWLDIEAMLAFTEPLDLEAIRSWLVRMLGAEDDRLEKLEALVARLES
jgi:hypothetical protein